MESSDQKDEVTIRLIRKSDAAEWARLRKLLWFYDPPEDLEAEMSSIWLDNQREAVFVAARPDNSLCGMVEVSLHDSAPGCESSPVGYLEGWYVEPDSRQRGIGKALAGAAEGWARAWGCTEMASDTDSNFPASPSVHGKLGYIETQRSIYFRKQIADLPDQPEKSLDRLAPRESKVLENLVSTLEKYDPVRAVLLTSSRAVPGRQVDPLSDFDIALIVSQLDDLTQDDRWIQEYGAVLVRLNEKISIDGVTVPTRLVIYEDDVKVDYSLWPGELVERYLSRGSLPDGLAAGYRVLLDKDGLASRLPSPRREVFIPLKPTREDYLSLVNEFWWESTYAAKNLWRNELVTARYHLDVWMRHELLEKMLVWEIETRHGWKHQPGLLGRGLQQKLLPGDWFMLQSTYTGPTISETWDALFTMISLFRKTAAEVGRQLGYAYPLELDHKVMEYLLRIERLQKPGNTKKYRTESSERNRDGDDQP